MTAATFAYTMAIVFLVLVASLFITKAIEAVFRARRQMRSDLIAWLTDHRYNLTHFPTDGAWCVSFFQQMPTDSLGVPDFSGIPVVIGRNKNWEEAIREAQEFRQRESIALAPDPPWQLAPGDKITLNEKAPRWAWGKVFIVETVEPWGVQTYSQESAQRAAKYSQIPTIKELRDLNDLVRLAVDWDQIAPATFENGGL